MSKPRGISPLEAAECFFRFGFDPISRVVHLGEVSGNNEDNSVCREMAQNFLKAMTTLDRTDGEILVVINTDGGSVVDGLAIYDMMRSCRNFVTAAVYGEASSMGCVILQGADKRLVSQNSTVMFHEGSEGYGQDHARNVAQALEYNKVLGDQIVGIVNASVLKKNPNKKLKNFWAFDRFYTAEQAVELGLADEIIPSR